ncbi:hypothetical protein K450DRAFT_250520 [Umbelopsis ramanniana AG]|uniref:Uncharacterized protein n=1 Tax=Umbelopsis ramanniana AG TaxID=1314678 RepID=A0AAD5E6M2_UMBRA|nr:uncharacterized protein K450DRAFT_250520 [Umbelopsis ramanniana AG]KAI8577722.1 hypothetical protein K450DRAFT_250520 [Umbelopsis ramanniana AG]
MAIWKVDPANPSERIQPAPSPEHPGNPKWLTGTEWRKRRQPSFIEMDKIMPPSSRNFGLDNSGWGSVNQDADGSGWGSSSAGASAGW